MPSRINHFRVEGPSESCFSTLGRTVARRDNQGVHFKGRWRGRAWTFHQRTTTPRFPPAGPHRRCRSNRGDESMSASLSRDTKDDTPHTPTEPLTEDAAALRLRVERELQRVQDQ